MNKKILLLILPAFAVVGIAFQNCGPQMRSTAVDSSSNNRITSGDGITFFAGQPYDVSLLPYEPQNQDEVDRVAAYPNWQGFKAMAFTEDGELYAASNTSSLINDQAEWDRVVLERCQLWSMNKACSLFASGDEVAQDAEHFINNFARTIQVPAQFDGNLIPGMIDYWKNYTATAYPDFTNNQFKAYAISPHGGGQTGWSDVDQAEATRRALEICESLSNTPCTVYAEGLDVLFDLETYEFGEQRVFYAPRAFNVDEIPFVTEAVRESIRTQYQQAVANGENFLLWMDRYGNYREILVDANNVNNRERMEAQARCDARIPPPADPAGQQRTCFLYSENGQVVMTRQSFLDSF